MTEERAALLGEATLGRQVEMFYESDVGQYVLKAAQQDVEAAQEKLNRVSPFRFWKVHEYQADIKKVKQALIWLNEVIMLGHQAKQLLEEGE